MKRFDTLFDYLLNSMAMIGGLLILCLIMIECYEIFARFLGHPTTWSVDFCEYSLYLIAFSGTAWVLKQNAHITVTVLIVLLKPRAKTYCHLLSSLMGGMVSFIIFWFASKLTWDYYVDAVQVAKTIPVQKWPFLSFAAFGYLLLLVEFVRQFCCDLRSLIKATSNNLNSEE